MICLMENGPTDQIIYVDKISLPLDKYKLVQQLTNLRNILLNNSQFPITCFIMLANQTIVLFLLFWEEGGGMKEVNYFEHHS